MSARTVVRAYERLLDRLLPWVLLVWFLLFAARILLEQVGTVDILSVAIAGRAMYVWAEDRGRQAERTKRAEPLGRVVAPRSHR